jgi:predicted amidophosphoribosyltransferase
LDIVYPVHCVICGEFGKSYLCDHCAINIPEPISKTSPCKNCLIDKPVYEGSLCVGEYSGNLMEAIHWFKYRDRPMLAKPLGQILLHFARQNKTKLNNLEFDIIIPVPMNPIRQRLRGYNQAECLARVLGKSLGIEVNSNLLANRQVQGKTIMIVDDVSTTGSSIKECANALKKAGASKVYALTLAAD